jgi:hypothetical protein
MECRLSPQTVVGRIESLEQRVTHLEQLPARVDALTEQISQLRTEMHGEFSASRAEMNAGLTAVRDEMRGGDERCLRTLREEIRAGDEETRRVLREEIRAGNAEIMSQVRTLHEDMMSRFALLQEGKPDRRRTKRR